jgi:hypothetical protein
MVVDYRALNRVTERRFFIIPNSDGIKSAVAGSRFISVGDLKEGFNQVESEEETAQKMAVWAASGSCLPRGLTFGPTNGPEDFQELVFIIFGRRLYREWFLFLDDLSVATGRANCLPPGPSGAADVVDGFASLRGRLPAMGGSETPPLASIWENDESPEPMQAVEEAVESATVTKKYLRAPRSMPSRR